jgi:hypothetical protein
MKNSILRIGIFCLLSVCAVAGPVWIFIVGAVGYILVYRGLEIVVLAAAIDAYFGYASDTWYMYTLFTAVGLLLAQWLQPYLSVYNQ